MIITEERLASISPTWQEWTPVWTTSTGAAIPSFGDAVLSCEYTVSATTCWGKFDVVFGATTNFGGGGGGDNWRFSLPLPGSTTHQVIGFAEINQSADHRLIARMRMTSTTYFELEVSSGAPDGIAVTANGLIDADTPWNNGASPAVGDWANGDSIRGTFCFEIAN
jgi:hypothetical protein